MICRSHLFEDDQYRDEDDDDDDGQYHGEVKYLKLQFGVLLLGNEARVMIMTNMRYHQADVVMIVIVIITSTFNMMVDMTQKMKNRCT